MITLRHVIVLVAMLFLSIYVFADTKVHLTPTNHVVMEGDFTPELTQEITLKFVRLIEQNRNMLTLTQKVPTLYLVIISNGGYVEPGLLMIDSLNALPAKIHTITLKGMSMGFITPQLLGKRYILPHGVLMTHKMKSGFSGLEIPGQLDSRYQFWLKRIFDINTHIISRTNGKHTVESYEALMENEYWCEGKNCVDMGFADDIVQLTCSIELYQPAISDQTYNFFGSNVTVKRTKYLCPMVSGGQTVGVNVDGQPYDFKDVRINNFLKLIEESQNAVLKINK